MFQLQGNHLLKLETTDHFNVVGPRWEYKVRLQPEDSEIHPKPLTELNRWQHVACIRDGDIVRLFVDGKLAASGKRAGKYEDDGDELVIGWVSDKFRGFAGDIREIRISTIARYETDFTPAMKFTADEHTLALYHADEGNGSVLQDSSGNDRHGTILGATWVEGSTATGSDEIAEVSPHAPAPDRERAAAEWVFSLGGVISIDPQAGPYGADRFRTADKLPNGEFQVSYIGLDQKEGVTNEGLANVSGLKNLRVLKLRGAELDDSGCAHLAESKSLTFLHLNFSKVGDAGLAHLRGLTNLGSLNLVGTRITDDGLVHLQGMKQLYELRLSETTVSDIGLANLRDLQQLAYLHLASTKITNNGLKLLSHLPLVSLDLNQSMINDDGLIHLKKISTLQGLHVLSTNVTAAGVADLQKALPNCKIEWDRNVTTSAPMPTVAPFDAAAAKQHQQAWAKYLDLSVEAEVKLSESEKIVLMLIPPGEFRMGAPDSDSDASDDEKPQHDVVLTRPFQISSTEVTVGQFRQFVESTGYVTEVETDGAGAYEVKRDERDSQLTWNLANKNADDRESLPVTCVSWKDGMEFCKWLGDTVGGTFRLPTEAEWEYACRAGSESRYSFGDEFDETFANARVGWLKHVAQYEPNAFGLFDMHGNVHEICTDSGRAYSPERVVDPRGPDGDTVVVRGGSAISALAKVRASQRYLVDPRDFPNAKFATQIKGFRVVRVVDVPNTP